MSGSEGMLLLNFWVTNAPSEPIQRTSVKAVLPKSLIRRCCEIGNSYTKIPNCAKFCCDRSRTVILTFHIPVVYCGRVPSMAWSRGSRAVSVSHSLKRNQKE